MNGLDIILGSDTYSRLRETGCKVGMCPPPWNGQAVRAIVSLGRFGSTIHTHRPGVPLEPAVEAFTIDANSKSEGFLKTCLREKSRRRETNTQTSSKKIAFVTGANKDIGFEVAHLSCRK
jgi:hypothetical protein